MLHLGLYLQQYHLHLPPLGSQLATGGSAALHQPNLLQRQLVMLLDNRESSCATCSALEQG